MISQIVAFSIAVARDAETLVSHAVELPTTRSQWLTTESLTTNDAPSKRIDSIVEFRTRIVELSQSHCEVPTFEFSISIKPFPPAETPRVSISELETYIDEFPPA